MTDPLIKLYAGLTDKERGKLAYAYSMKGNDLETARITSTMTDQRFIGLPYEYRRMIGNLQSLTFIYSMAYWQQVARCLAMLAALQAKLHDPDDHKAYLPIKAQFQAAEAVLLAVDQAFNDVCLEHGLDGELIRGMVGTRFYEIATPDLKPDDVCLTGYRETFAMPFAAD